MDLCRGIGRFPRSGKQVSLLPWTDSDNSDSGLAPSERSWGSSDARIDHTSTSHAVAMYTDHEGRAPRENVRRLPGGQLRTDSPQRLLHAVQEVYPDRDGSFRHKSDWKAASRFVVKSTTHRFYHVVFATLAGWRSWQSLSAPSPPPRAQRACEHVVQPHDRRSTASTFCPPRNRRAHGLPPCCFSAARASVILLRVRSC